MTNQRIRQPKIADIIEQKIESLIVEGVLSEGQKLPPERELAAQFDVSRPSIREAIQRLEAKKLLTRKQGGGTFVSKTLWSSFADPLLDLLGSHHEIQSDLLESRHAMEGIAAYFAALRGTDEDFKRISDCQAQIEKAIANNSMEQEARAVMNLLIAIAEASHNVVLLHIIRSLSGLLELNVLENLRHLSRREEVVQKVGYHRATMVKAILNRDPEQARLASYSHLAYIEDTLLELKQEEMRRERSLRRLQQI